MHKTFRILHTADWHLDRKNLDYTLPVTKYLADLALEHDVDVVVNAGDLAMHRGNIHPDVALAARRAMLDLARATRTGKAVFVSGNHDMAISAQQHGIGAGVFSGRYDGESADGTIIVAEQPRVHTFPIAPGLDCHLVLVPTPNKKAAQAALGDGVNIDGLLQQAVAGLVSEAADASAGPILAVYHGTVRGAKLGNEMVMKAGVDVSLPHEAFAGCEAVLAGHIHHAQIMQGSPRVYYPGAIAPLTWNDKRLVPKCYIYTIEAAGEEWTLDVEAFDLPVISQMLEIEEAIDDSIGASTAATRMFDLCFHAGAKEGDRVRVTLRGPSNALANFGSAVADGVKAKLKLRDLRIVCDRSDPRKVEAIADRHWTMADAFTEWATAKGTPGDIMPGALECVDEVERYILDKHIDARYECKPIRLAAYNWCQYESIRIEFDQLGNICNISGPNFAGKSNVARLLLFTRYKRQECGDNLADLVRKGHDSMWAQETFEHGGDVYRVTRSVKVGGTGRVSADMTLEVDSGNEFVVVNEGTVRETQEHLETLIGPYELFRATTYAGQNDVDGLLDLKPAELKDVLLSVLQRDFAARSKVCRDKMASLNVERAKAEEGQTNASRIADRLAIADMELAAAKMEREEAVDARADLPGAKTLAEAIGTAKARLDALNAKRAELESAEGKREAASRMLRAVTGDLGAAATAAALGDMAKADAAALPTGADLDRAAEEADAAKHDVEQHKIGIDALAALHAAAKQSEAAYARAADGARHMVSIIEIDLRGKQVAGETIAEVPCKGATWHTDRLESVDMSACKFLTSAQAAKDELPELRRRLLEATAKHGEAQQMLDAAAEATALTLNNWQSEANKERAAQLDRAHRDAIAKRDSIRRDAAKRRDLEQASAAADEARLSMAGLIASKKALEDDIQRYETAAALMPSTAECTKAADELLEAKRQYDALMVRYAAADSHIVACEQRVSSIEGRLVALREEADQWKNCNDTLLAVERSYAAWGLVSDAMNRDGIPYVMLERFAIPAMEELINRYLEATDIRVTVASARELTSGELRADVVLRFTDHRGSHPISAASGYQRTVIGMALRNALADLHARATGSRIWLSVQDEGFGTMDEENMDRARATIQAIAAERGLFMFISHVPGLESVADTVLRVRDSAGISTVEVER